MEQAISLARAIEAASANQPIQTSIADEEFRDYLLSSLTIALPNQTSREFNNIPASTQTGEVIQNATSEPSSEPSSDQAATIVQVQTEGSIRQIDLRALIAR